VKGGSLKGKGVGEVWKSQKCQLVFCLLTLQQEIQPTCNIKKSNSLFSAREKQGEDNRGRFFSYSTIKNG